jgi:hypothetical protein
MTVNAANEAERDRSANDEQDAGPGKDDDGR